MMNPNKKKVDYIPHSRPTLGEKEVKAVDEVIKSGHIAEGEVVDRFEKAFTQKMGVRHAVAVSSGTAALHLALLAIGVGSGDEVIFPSYVCTALLHAVQYVGATPVPADIEPATNNIDPDDVQKRITARTRAVIVPHMFGLSADLDSLRKLGVPIIEDCAQAIGSTFRQQPLGTFGNISIFSFYATKVLAAGEGGMVTSNSNKLMRRVRDLKTYDQKEADKTRYNYKMSDIHAAMGLVQFGQLDDFVERRRKIARRYFESFKSIQLQLPAENSEHIYFRFVVGLETNCDRLIRKLSRKGIGCARPVFLPIHRHLRMDGYPITDKVWETSLSIPIYPSLAAEEVDRIINGFIDVYAE